jgi:REP element-mobilizing transposase RayT
MSNTYTQLHIHCVFAVQFRKAVLDPSWDERLRLYVTATLQNNGHKMLAINNLFDHMHFFVGLNPDQSISTMMRLAKGDSAEWINKEKLTQAKFQWQSGYGAFSYSKSQVNSVVKYIHNQQKHHRKINFLTEYREMLKSFSIDFDNRYLFTPLVD